MRDASLLLIIFLSILACKTEQLVNEVNTESLCNTLAQVADYSDLDGCRKILITDNGDKILPSDSSIVESYATKSYVKIGYKKLEGVASACMAEDFIADIICIENTEIPMPKECINAQNIEELTWENIKNKKSAIESIGKYAFLGDGWAYILSYKDQQKEVYNCQGDLLCTFEEKADPTCQQMINEMTYMKTIFGEDKKSK